MLAFHGGVTARGAEEHRVKSFELAALATDTAYLSGQPFVTPL